MRAKYCKCKNTYTTADCDRDCNAPYYWKQGIGSLVNQHNSVISHVPSAFSNGFSKGFK
jgi:hypothetical protein